MPKKLHITNNSDGPLVDDDLYDRLSKHNWFKDRRHYYTKISIPITDDPFHKSVTVKVRLDRYILRLTPYNNAVINQGNDNDYTRRSLDVVRKSGLIDKKWTTIYRGVFRLKKKVVAEYRSKKGELLWSKSFPVKNNATREDYYRAERQAAEAYDAFARYVEGELAKTNFLPKGV